MVTQHFKPLKRGKMPCLIEFVLRNGLLNETLDHLPVRLSKTLNIRPSAFDLQDVQCHRLAVEPAYDRQSSLISEKSSRVDCRQKQPLFMQQCLNFLIEPQGQGSLRPSFSMSCLLPCTIRSPRLTWVSDGNPLRRLLVRSKKGAVLLWMMMLCHMCLLVQSAAGINSMHSI